ncbi:MAG TPA: bifunctional 3,4-dihydroxy-2-butanone-4-phosphate synthase/GTP cyclohydrolase II [Candidatus Brocadiia bacterium]|nr:bifunctional 3,4-dihydroxy-2-butanone-4-phosphate synthase/GTP cyclohydrolase II [Candidatus Brocadiia bacterium]
MPLNTIPEILEDISAGKFVIVVDDAARENEGDLTLAAEMVDPEKISFLMNHGKGIICMAISEDVAVRLDLPPMVARNLSRFATPFTVSIDSSQGITTGVCAADRAKTIQDAINDNAKPGDLVRPGHVFPLTSRKGGTLVRTGHTEAAVDLMNMAGMRPGAVICEVVTDNGTMARLPELELLATRFNLKICTIADIIEYRRRKERLIEKVVSVPLKTRHGDFKLHFYRSLIDDYQHIAICAGEIGSDGDEPAPPIDEPVMVRVHDECFTGDVLGSLKCDCGEQLNHALEMVHAAGRGVVLYMRQEGRGIGLENKLKAYKLQQQGLDTVEANQELGFPADRREYGIGAQILKHLGLRKLRLITNNPRKFNALSGYDLEIVERIPIRIPPKPENYRYLRTKQDKMGHDLGLPSEGHCRQEKAE